MVLSVFMVQTLTTLLEPPPAIGGGGGKGLMQPGHSYQPQANIAVFMFLFMLCAAEVVFIKLLALTTFGDHSETTQSATPPGAAPASGASSAGPPSPTAAVTSGHGTDATEVRGA